MKEWDPTGKQGPKQPMPDLVTVLQPKDEEPISDKPTIGAPQCAADRMGYKRCNGTCTRGMPGPMATCT